MYSKLRGSESVNFSNGLITDSYIRHTKTNVLRSSVTDLLYHLIELYCREKQISTET